MQSTRMARLIGMLLPVALIALVDWLSPFIRSPATLSALPLEVRSPARRRDAADARA